MTYVIDFVPPLEGMGGEFNTIRLGQAWAKRIKEGDKVFLMDNKERRIFGVAVVTGLHLGTLEEICKQHGIFNHTAIANPDFSNSSDETCRHNAATHVLNVLQKFNGPHIATPTKKSIAIYLKRSI
jgi:hypothetical protein